VTTPSPSHSRNFEFLELFPWLPHGFAAIDGLSLF
jgi:hypothetical protein